MSHVPVLAEVSSQCEIELYAQRSMSYIKLVNKCCY